MTLREPLHTRDLTIIAQDPSVRNRQKQIIRARVTVPAEDFAPGPWGYRVHVVDYDSSTDLLYKPLKYLKAIDGLDVDPFENASDEELLRNPNFHAQNVYAIVMRILTRFEFALGRRVSWSFYGHQIKVAPHAFADANAFYSENDQALFFGYFPGKRGMVWSCLSHDIVAHETTHALLDGLRQRYTDPSSPDQAGFHEGFADVVALLSVFSLEDVVRTIIDLTSHPHHAKLIKIADVRPEGLRKSLLFGLAKEMGQELSGLRGDVLRRSASMKPSPIYIEDPEYEEPHNRGEILVAVMMNAFLQVWSNRLSKLGEVSPGYLDRGRVVEEGSEVANYLLTMSIRALDYTPPVDIEFADFLSAVLTSDREINPNDSKYEFRRILRESFSSYGIMPASRGTATEPGIWHSPKSNYNYGRTHLESIQRDRDEVFRFIWDNRKALHLYEGAYSRVLSVRPCLRIGPDGFALRETVAEYMQMLTLDSKELKALRINVPRDVPADQPITLYGGGALIFNEYGGLKYHINNRIDNYQRQAKRLKYLSRFGFFKTGEAAFRNFANLHQRRTTNNANCALEEW